MLCCNAEVEGEAGLDCRIRDGVVAEVARRLTRELGEEVLDAGGGALLPGLADHHLHLLALAAAWASVDLAPATSQDDARAVLVSAAGARPAGTWVRAVGYDELAHGNLDRWLLDTWVADTPLRVQHRSGALWVVNSAACQALDLDGAVLPEIERDATGRPTGRLWRADRFLADAIGAEPPDLTPVGERLASYGITHVTDATPDGDGAVGRLIAAAVEAGRLRQRVQVTCAGAGAVADASVNLGPLKIVVSDHELPSLAQLTDEIRGARSAGRAVAIHCVTREALLLAAAALEAVGPNPRDRIEHCAVAGAETVEALARLGVAVVTQPSLVAARGDVYLEHTESRDRCDLWRYRSLLEAGVRVAPSSDAPYGDLDPWAMLRAARDRLAPSRRVVGECERVSPAQALRGALSPLSDPGGRPRRLRPGAPADLVLLDRPLGAALRDPDAGCVRATLIDGEVVYTSAAS